MARGNLNTGCQLSQLCAVVGYVIVFILALWSRVLIVKMAAVILTSRIALLSSPELHSCIAS
jgi:hypothetical protein